MRVFGRTLTAPLFQAAILLTTAAFAMLQLSGYIRKPGGLLSVGGGGAN